MEGEINVISLVANVETFPSGISCVNCGKMILVSLKARVESFRLHPFFLEPPSPDLVDKLV